MPIDDPLGTELSRLYWETDASVGEIADQLGISRRALYEALHPLPAGVPCPDCGTGLVYTRRSGLAAGEAICPACGLEPDVAWLRAATAEAGPALRRAVDRAEAAAEARELGAGGAQREDDAAQQAGAGAGRAPEDAAESDLEHHETAGELAPLDTAAALDRSHAFLIGVAAVAGIVAGSVAVLLAGRRG